jgi:hypothetical protein
MAGKRRGRGPGGTTKPRQCDVRQPDGPRRVREAKTVKLALAAVFDRYRSALYKHPDRERLARAKIAELDREAAELEKAS